MSLRRLSVSPSVGEALEGADPDMAVLQPDEHGGTGGRGLVVALQRLAGLDQREGLRGLDAERLEHLGREHLAHAALQGQPAVAEAAIGGLARALGAEIEQAALRRRAAARTGSRGRRRCRDCTRGTDGRDSAAPAARADCPAAARSGRNGGSIPSSVSPPSPTAAAQRSLRKRRIACGKSAGAHRIVKVVAELEDRRFGPIARRVADGGVHRLDRELGGSRGAGAWRIGPMAIGCRATG